MPFRTRKFNNKTFDLSARVKTKEGADFTADIARQRGQQARVVEGGKKDKAEGLDWLVYTHGEATQDIKVEKPRKKKKKDPRVITITLGPKLARLKAEQDAEARAKKRK